MKNLEQLILDDAHATLPDDGFSARVMRSLPAPQPRRATWRPALILGSTALGGVLAALFAPANATAMQGVLDLSALHFLTPGALAVFGIALTLAVAGSILAAEE